MKITTQNVRYKTLNNNTRVLPKYPPQKSDINFTGQFFTVIKNGKGDKVFKEFPALVKEIDSVLGGDYLKKLLRSIGVNPEETQEYILKDQSVISDLYKTLRYPFLDVPLDIAIFLSKSVLKKIPFLSGVADKALNSDLLSKRIKAVEVEKNTEIVQNILNDFTDSIGKTLDNGTDKYDLNFCKKAFVNKLLDTSGKVVKNYNTRDERTLNRIGTSLVSACFGARDFYNISMLQKDSKKEAKRAEKSRFKQEVTRTGLNALMTFFTLGVLDKYTKNNLPLTVATIVGSTLVSEVLSRIINKVSLVPLTPKRAAKIAKAKKAKYAKSENNNTQKVQEQQKNSVNNAKLSFKSSKNDFNTKLFEAFEQKDGILPAVNYIKENKNNKQRNIKHKNKMSLKKILGIAFGSVSGLYLLLYFLSGKYNKDTRKIQFANKRAEDLRNIINSNEKYNGALLRKLKNEEFLDAKSVQYPLFVEKIKGFVSSIKDFFHDFDKKQIKVDASELMKKVEEMEKLPEADEIKSLLEMYKQALSNQNKVSVKVSSVPKGVIASIGKGIKKIFNSAWLILSSPGAMVKNLIEKTHNQEALSLYNKAAKKAKVLNQEPNELNLDFIYKMVEKYPDASQRIREISKRTKIFGAKSETSEIANYSRAFVTLITSYFFVNDYYNKVLIESEGKNVSEAQEERNERIAHKLSNFVINGTLMNLFNTVFNKALNNSLIQATAIAMATETTNEFLVRKSICQPIGRMDSKDEIIKWEEKQTSKKGPMGAWSRFFRKITGKKTLTEKAHIDVAKEKEAQKQKAKSA